MAIAYMNLPWRSRARNGPGGTWIKRNPLQIAIDDALAKRISAMKRGTSANEAVAQEKIAKIG